MVGAPAWAAMLQPGPFDNSDVIVGVGTAGPYALTWTNILSASEQVEVNGVPLLRGIGYTIDWAAGTITLSRPLAADGTARVSYLRQPGKSQLNQQPVDFPAAIPLAVAGDTNLALALRFQQQPNEGARGIYGVRGGHSGATKVDAAFFFSEPAGGGRTAADAGRSSGWRVGAQRSYSELDVAASLTRTEKGFSAPKDLAAPAGQETLSLAATYRPSATVTANASTVTAEDLSDPARPTTRTNEFALAAKPLDGADVTVTRTEVESQRPSGSTSRTTDKVAANMALGDDTTASASYQTSVGDKGRSETDSLRVASSLRPGLKVVASQSETRSDSAYQRASDVALDVAASNRGRLRAVVGARRGSEVEDYQGVEGTLKPSAALTIDAAYKQRDYGDTDLDTRRAAVSVSPLRGLEIGGEYAENPEDANGNVRQVTTTTARVGTQLGVIGLSGSMAREIAVAGDERRAGEVRLSLALASAHRLYTGYRQVETIPVSGAATGATEVYMLGYERAVGSDFSLSIEGAVERNRDYQQLRSDTQERANAKLNWRF